MKRKFLAIVIIVVVVAAAAGLGVYELAILPRSQTFLVNYSVSFIMLPRFAPLFVAQDKGYFSQQGLNVKILPASGQPGALQDLVSGTFTVTYCDAFSAAVAIAKGAQIKYVTTIYSSTPMVAFAKPSIKTTKQLEGTTWAQSGPGDLNYVLLPLFAQNAGFNYSSLKIQTVSPNLRISLFLAGKVNATSSFSFSIPQVKAAMPNATIFNWADYGIQDQEGLCVSNSLIAQHPNVVKGIVEATIKGFYYTLANPDSAASIYLKYNPSQNMTQALGEIGVLQQLDNTSAFRTNGIGWTNTTQMNIALNEANQYGGYNTTLTASQLYDTSFFPGKLGNLVIGNTTS
ncbi:MAG: ABC transporter substrate-binding protein [Nitrososphaerota archaeon]|nr:ABC transporter substrate-binding protein [Nitrososphaerota archaeon]